MRDIKSLDLNLLKALDALLDEGSVTRAATRLGLTQPAVSGMLTRLRDSFDDPLFVRGQRGIVPTPRAQELAQPLREVLAEIQALLQPASFDPASADYTLTLAATDYALQTVVVPFVAELSRRAPGIRVAVRPVDNDQAQSLMARGQLDLALLTPDTTAPDLHMRPLFQESYACALRAGHPACAAGALTLDRFCDLGHALVSYSGERFWGVTDEALARIGRSRRVALSVTSFLVLIEILRTTDLITVAPSRLMARAAGLTLMAPPVDIPGFTKVAAWHDRTHRDPGQRWVRALLFETCARTDPPAGPDRLDKAAS